MIRAGRLRHRLVIERATESRDSHGEPIQTWWTLATRWGSVEPVSGREYREGDAVAAQVSHRIMLRANGLTITPKDRIRFGSRLFGIEFIGDRDERGFVLEIQAREAV